MDPDTEITVSLRSTRRLLVVLGGVHLLVPGILLRVAGTLYGRVLGVEFEPTAQATKRVRLVGLCMLAVSVLSRLVERGHSTQQAE